MGVLSAILESAGRMSWAAQVFGAGMVNSRLVVPVQTVDATLAWSLLAGVSKPKVFLGR
jgi:hypothetical protein